MAKTGSISPLPPNIRQTTFEIDTINATKTPITNNAQSVASRASVGRGASLQTTRIERASSQSQQTSSLESYDILQIFKLDFWNNIYVIERFLLFIICVILIILCILYGIGQISKLQLKNYFCENKTLEEIYEHSQKFNLTGGTTQGL